MEKKATKERPKPTKSLDAHFNTLEVQLREAILHTWQATTSLTYIESLREYAHVLANQVVEIGNTADYYWEEEDRTTEYGYVLFEWMTQAKDFLVLWRNILFETQKAYLQQTEGVIDMATMDALGKQSESVVSAASTSIKTLPTLHELQAPLFLKKVEQWKLQHNPWEVYHGQLQAIPTHCDRLVEQANELQALAESFDTIKRHFTNTFDAYLHNLDTLSEKTQNVLDNLLTVTEDYQGSKVTGAMKNIQEETTLYGDVTGFNNQLDKLVEVLSTKQKVVVDVQEGRLFYKELDIQRASAFWLESELMTIVYDFYNIKNSVHNQLNLTALNIKNRVDFEKQDGQQPARKEIISALNNFLKSIEKSKEEVATLETQLQRRFEQEFKASYIYEPEFLPVSMTSTLNQYRRYQNKGVEYVREWIRQRDLSLRNFRRSVLKQDSLSISEKIVRVVRQRIPQEENKHYTNMFLTSGYIGDTFWVGRTEEMQRIRQIVENWKLGFRGAILITGKRYSGKTLLGALVSQEYFANKTIELRPNEKIRFAGRDFEVGYDLREVLDFVVKHSLQRPQMVWIDDFEYWQNDKISFGQNIRNLVHTIDQYSGRLFFVVSMSNWLKVQLHHFYEIEKAFQAEINTDRMEIEEVKRTILIRHNATQMTLLNAEGNATDAAQLDKKIKQLYKNAEGNVGEVLQQWACLVHRHSEEEVRWDATPLYRLPDFLNKDMAIVLRTIMMEKMTREYYLRKRFGPAFKDVYQPLIQRMFYMGLLHRHLNGDLEVNPFLTNDIGRMLQHEIGFSFDGTIVQKTITQPQ